MQYSKERLISMLQKSEGYPGKNDRAVAICAHLDSLYPDWDASATQPTMQPSDLLEAARALNTQAK